MDLLIKSECIMFCYHDGNVFYINLVIIAMGAGSFEMFENFASLYAAILYCRVIVLLYWLFN